MTMVADLFDLNVVYVYFTPFPLSAGIHFLKSPFIIRWFHMKRMSSTILLMRRNEIKPYGDSRSQAAPPYGLYAIRRIIYSS